MKGTPTTMVYFNDTEQTGFAEPSDEMQEFGADVESGDYVTVVYQTPSNGGSWHRFGGEVIRTREFQGRVDDVWIENDTDTTDRDEAGETAHLHINPETGDYSFTDDVGSMERWGIKKMAYTPKTTA